MLIYERNKKLFGTMNNIPNSYDTRLIYRDKDNKIIYPKLNQSYFSDNHGGIKDQNNSEINVFINEKNIIPGNLSDVNIIDMTAPVKVEDYLYEITYNDYDLEVANNSFEQLAPPVSACTSCRNGNFIGRNFDWNYDHQAAFILKAPATSTRHASIGVTGATQQLTNEFVESGKFSNSYYNLPYRTVDGINDAGVYVNTNVVPLDKGITIGTNPGKQRLCSFMMPRVILDKASSALEAIALFNEYDLYAPYAIHYDLHFMIADNTSTYIVEFVNNQIHVLSNQEDAYDNLIDLIMTNFFLSGWNGEIKTGYLGNTEVEINETGLTPHAEGLERYSKIKAGLSTATDKDKMMQLMKSVWYTNAYKETTDPFWYSEFTEIYPEVDIYSPIEKYLSIKQKAIEIYNQTTRNKADTWQTCHTSIYDIQYNTFDIICQEGNSIYSYSL